MRPSRRPCGGSRSFVLLPKLFGTVERARLQAQLSPVRLLSQLLGFLLKHMPSVPAPVPLFSLLLCARGSSLNFAILPIG